MFEDRQLTCIDCSQPFIFTAGEQDFYDKKGFKEEPKRCKPCRDARKNKRQAGGYERMQGGGGGDEDSIGNRAESASTSYGFARSNRSYGGPGGGAARGGGGGANRELFDAVCAQCGGAARVPFRPSPGRPVYCRDCFGSRAGGIS